MVACVPCPFSVLPSAPPTRPPPSKPTTIVYTPTNQQMESPQEDEFGLVNLCGLSPYLGAIFARSERAMQEKGYIKYLSFKVRIE